MGGPRTSLGMSAALLTTWPSLRVKSAWTSRASLAMNAALLAIWPSLGVETAWTSRSGLAVSAPWTSWSSLAMRAVRLILPMSAALLTARSGLAVMLLFLRFSFVSSSFAVASAVVRRGS